MVALQNFSNHGTVYVCARFQSRISLKNETSQKNCCERFDHADCHGCACLSSDLARQLCRRPPYHRFAPNHANNAGRPIFVFLTTSIGLVMQSRGIAYHLREKSLVSLLSAFLVSVMMVLSLRMPYSSVFLFWGFILQIMVCVPTLLLFEKFNKPVIGIPETSLADFADLIAPDFVRPIMPTMDKVTELDLIILKESELASEEWSDLLINCIKSRLMWRSTQTQGAPER